MDEMDFTKQNCERCGREVETATAYHQMEWTRFGGSRIQVNVYYCERCRQLLQMVGRGEHSEMHSRQGYDEEFE